MMMLISILLDGKYRKEYRYERENKAGLAALKVTVGRQTFMVFQPVH